MFPHVTPKSGKNHGGEMYLKPSPISSAAYTAAHLLGVASLSQEYVARTTLASLMGKQLVGWWGGERERDPVGQRNTPPASG